MDSIDYSLRHLTGEILATLSNTCLPGPVYAKDQHLRVRTCVAQRGFLQCTKGEDERLASVRIAYLKRRQHYDRSMDDAPMAGTGRIR